MSGTCNGIVTEFGFDRSCQSNRFFGHLRWSLVRVNRHDVSEIRRRLQQSFVVFLKAILIDRVKDARLRIFVANGCGVVVVGGRDVKNFKSSRTNCAR
jgi:hypothetical protein